LQKACFCPSFAAASTSGATANTAQGNVLDCTENMARVDGAIIDLRLQKKDDGKFKASITIKSNVFGRVFRPPERASPP
jgi:hypothetical protein